MPIAHQIPFPNLVLPTESKTPLTLQEVQAVFDQMSWSFINELLEEQEREQGSYGKSAPISMCKALVLPYLTHVSSLADLARKLEDHNAYRVVCGFRGHTPSRAQLWHFQNAPWQGAKRRKRKGLVDPDRRTWFYQVLYHILARITVVGFAQGSNLPFCSSVSPAIWQEVEHTLTRTELQIPERPGWEFHLACTQSVALPVYARLLEPGESAKFFSMQHPPWWKAKDAEPYHVEEGEVRSVQQYTACSAIIVSESNQVLLGKRKAGYKPGYYALPGGQRRSGETLAECIEREVEEETGLKILTPCPVSISFNRDDSEQQECWSIGVLVTQYTGKVTLREPEKCEGWNWYSLDALPQTLFRPSEIIIDDYQFQQFPNLTWQQIESRIEKTDQDNVEPISTRQLRLLL